MQQAIAKSGIGFQGMAECVTQIEQGSPVLGLAFILADDSCLGADAGRDRMAERVGLAQSPLSQHLSKLRAWDFVKTRREGQQIYYAVASDEVRQVLETLYGIYCVREAA